MNASTTQTTRPGAEFSQAMKSLSEKAHIPVREVEEIFSRELARLRAEARIASFTGVLAIRRTREILLESQRRSARS